jgi:hypothetical protein
VKQTSLLATVTAGIVLGAIFFLFLSSTVEAATVICTLKKVSSTIKISTGIIGGDVHATMNHPSKTHKQINGGNWIPVSGTPQENCATYRAKGYK